MKRNIRFFFVAVFALGTIAGIVIATDGQARSAVLAIVTCATTTACTGGTNTSTGPGVQGQSAKGHGVVGNTTFVSTNNTNGESAVLGQDLSTSGVYDMGVQGVSVRGYGVRGKSTSNVGVRGDSTSLYGVEGTSASNSAVFGLSTNSIGVSGQSTNYLGVFGSGPTYGTYGSATGGYGAVGISQNVGVYASGSNYGLYGSSSGRGVLGITGPGQAVYAQSTSGRAFEGHTSSGLGLYVTNGTGNGGDIAGSYIGIVGRSDVFPLVATNAAGTANLFWVDGSGNIHYTGALVHNSAVGASTIETSNTQATSPSIEETGTARLTFGQANVYLSPSLARSLNAGRGYQVFLTPGGETRGLYVATKYTGGFVVREMQGGRSNISFDYHVYASTAAPAAAASTLRAPRAPTVQPAAVPVVAAPRTPAVQRPPQ